MGTDALTEVAEYVALQKQLLLSLAPSAEFDSQGDAYLTSLARTGDVVVGTDSWSYKLHGAGVLFQHGATGRQVDVHRHLARPDLFDAWRLRTYFGSLGGRGVKLVEHAIGSKGQPLDKAIELLLQRWLAAGKITEEEGSYRLTS